MHIGNNLYDKLVKLLSPQFSGGSKDVNNVSISDLHKHIEELKELHKQKDLEIEELKKNTRKPRKIKSFDELYEEKKNYSFASPLKVGFSYCSLGWKTKWSDTDFRYEHGPVLSFVFFGYQIALMVGQKNVSHYWEAWLYYEYVTDKTKSKRERIEQCKKEFPLTYKVYSQGKEEVVYYYPQILKSKYLK